MYSNPTFDPNPLASADSTTEELAYLQDTLQKDPQGRVAFTSLAYQDIGFPGSTFKIVTASAAYQYAPQLVNASMTSYACIPPGTFKGQTTELCNFDHNESCGGTIAEMLPPSCDTGFALLGTKVGAFPMVAEANSFGFNQQPPIDLPHTPYEVSDFLQPSCYENTQVYLAFSSIGQFCTKASPLQMAFPGTGDKEQGTRDPADKSVQPRGISSDSRQPKKTCPIKKHRKPLTMQWQTREMAYQ